MPTILCGPRGACRHPWVLILVGVTAAGLACPRPSTAATTKTNPQPTPNEFVQQALLSEISGQNAERARLLEQALNRSPDSAPARWHTGHVRLRGQWVKVDHVPLLVKGDPRYGEYLRVREQYADTTEGQLELGLWCEKRRLKDQARAHFTRVLQMSPDHGQARARLGYRRVEGVWVLPDEIQQWCSRDRQMREDFAEWESKVERIRRRLGEKGRGEPPQETAKAELAAIAKPEAIPAMEWVLGRSDEKEARLLVDTLSSMAGHEASLALARQAVFCPWTAVRHAALDEIRTRPLEDFVPLMLAAMYTPILSRTEILPGTNGVLVRHTLSCEGYEAKEETVFETAYVSLLGYFPGFLAGRDVQNRVQSREIWAFRQNMLASELNGRISVTLNAITGQELPATPQVWWKWWDEYDEARAAGKPVARRYLADQVTYRLPRVPPSPFSWLHVSCFAAGTPVWTVDGPRPIERLQVGDLVLSQDPETGRLAYKPVLRATVGSAIELVNVVVGDDSFDCTGGHLFWVSGEGWVRARRLRPGALLHGVTGTVSVEAVEAGPTAETYNLVVADFHSYFVGRSKSLVHDVTPRRPTTTVVPGVGTPFQRGFDDETPQAKP